jgi:pSer/pThr/pTyr-binding forkhead associated (FHA) protein
MDSEAVHPATKPLWLTELQASRETDTPALAFDRGDGPEVFELAEGWTRIGRTRAADVRLDDPTVSRRHALVVLTPEGELRALDDRSLNGLFVNGEQVEWAPLSDADELEIGRYRLYVLA